MSSEKEEPSFADLPVALARAERAALQLGMLAESIERVEDDPSKRAALIPLTIAAGEFRDRLHCLQLDMKRAGFI
jgi:hypothetical protein